MISRLPACTARDVDRALKRAGFAVAHQKGSRRSCVSPYTGKIAACVPMHRGDIKRPLLKKTSRTQD
jgi:predicted RNA binding protein YcfA (HicA-like mRNA interferase family)